MAQGLYRIDAGQPLAPFIDTSVPLFTIAQANFNVTTDQAMFPTFPTSLYNTFIIERVLVLNASVALTTAAGGFYSAAAKAGLVLVSAATTYAGATAAATAGQSVLPAATGAGLLPLTTPPIFSLTTPQGAAAFADIVVYGRLVT
jgi:hypothetical protein